MKKSIANIFFKIPAIRNYAQKQYQHNILAYRQYAAAVNNRFTTDWFTEQGSINKEIKYAFKSLLSRARDLDKNNDYVRGFIKRCVTNIVGPEGFKLQNRAVNTNGEPDENINIMIEDSFYEWCKRNNCTIHKNLSFIEVQKLTVKQWKRDGNIIVREITGKAAQNKFNYALQLLEVDLLDIDKNEQLKNGNAVILGIEFNNNKQVLAYYFKSNSAYDEATQGFYGTLKSQSIRIPAEEIIHHFTKDHSNQLLGVTALAQSMLTFHDMQGLDQAVIINMRAGASKMGFLQTQPNAMPSQYKGDSEDANGNIISNFSFGEIEQLPAGLEFKGWDPAYPNGEFAPTKKHFLRKLATGLGVAYANWVGDLEAVNFSSMRSGLLDERDNWMDDQTSYREGFLIPIFNRWLKFAILSKQVKVDYLEYERINQPEFIGRRWPWVDPRADAEAKKLMLDNNMALHTDTLAELGLDFNDYIRRRKKELEALKEIKLLEKELFGKEQPAANTQNNNQNNNNGNGKALLKEFIKDKN